MKLLFYFINYGLSGRGDSRIARKICTHKTRLPCKGSCRAYARLRDLEMKKHMYFVQSLRHFLTKMTPPFTREAFW